MYLNELPHEILLEIFDYVSEIDLWKNVRTTCRRFNLLLRPNSLWLNRAQKYHGLQLPERLKPETEEVAGGVKIFAATETASKKWLVERALGYPKSCQVHYGTIDAVKIFRASNKHRFCLTGARDRSIVLWDMERILTDCDKEKWVVNRVDNAHEGWIWDIATMGDRTFYSASWDSTLKQFYINEADVVPGAQSSFDAAVLSCVSAGENILYTSTFKRGPIMCDIRTGIVPVRELNCHNSRSVYAMATEEGSNYVFSVGEDLRLIAVDTRMFLPVHSYETNNPISHVDFSSGYLGISLRNGLLKFFDPNTLRIEHELQMELSETVTHNGHISLRLSQGAFACAYDYSMKIFTAGLNPKLLGETSLETAITEMDFTNNALAAGMGMGSMYFWA